MDGRCTIFVNEGAWRVACVSAEGVSVQAVVAEPDAEPAAWAQAAASLIRELGGAGPVVVALPSDWCLTTTVASDEVGRANRRQLLAYLLEEHLPLSAEDAVADYVEQQGIAFGVCVELQRIKPAIDAIEAQGVAVRHICPAELLAAAPLAEAHRDADALFVGPLVAEAEESADTAVSSDLIELSGKSPIRWWWINDASTLDEQLAAMRHARGGEKVAVASVGHWPGSEHADHTASDLLDPEHAIATYAARLIDGEVSPWIDLRRDRLAAPDANELYQKHIAGVVFAALLLLVCLGGAMLWRGHQYEQRAQELLVEQTQAYKQAFPDKDVPSASIILRRMRSELQRLEGIGGTAQAGDAGDNPTLQPISALMHLHNVVTALPPDLRYQISDMTIEPDLIRIDGIAETPVVAGAISRAIDQTGTYDAEPANTRARGALGVTFDFAVRPVEKPEQRPAVKGAGS